MCACRTGAGLGKRFKRDVGVSGETLATTGIQLGVLRNWSAQNIMQNMKPTEGLTNSMRSRAEEDNKQLVSTSFNQGLRFFNIRLYNHMTDNKWQKKNTFDIYTIGLHIYNQKYHWTPILCFFLVFYNLGFSSTTTYVINLWDLLAMSVLSECHRKERNGRSFFMTEARRSIRSRKRILFSRSLNFQSFIPIGQYFIIKETISIKQPTGIPRRNTTTNRPCHKRKQPQMAERYLQIRHPHCSTGATRNQC